MHASFKALARHACSLLVKQRKYSLVLRRTIVAEGGDCRFICLWSGVSVIGMDQVLWAMHLRYLHIHSYTHLSGTLGYSPPWPSKPLLQWSVLCGLWPSLCRGTSGPHLVPSPSCLRSPAFATVMWHARDLLGIFACTN